MPPRLAVELLHHFGPDWTIAGREALVSAGISPAAAARLADPSQADQAEGLMRECDKLGISWMSIEDEAYPEPLRRCEDAPFVLFWRGRSPALYSRNLAIVGTRKCTSYGIKMTRSIVQELAPLQPLIISGMAYGIDICAHMAALDFGLNTWGIFAQGLDRVYPGEHRQQAYRILEAGGTLISEFPPGIPSRAYHFPRRNRIVAGLADAVLVIESPPEGGSLITAGIAQSYHREVFAVPGPADRLASAGCHKLIREHGAALITGGRDLAEALDWIPHSAAHGASLFSGVEFVVLTIETALPESLSDLRDLLLWLVREGPQHVEVIAGKCGWPPQHLRGRLLEAELGGWLNSRAGGYFECVCPR